VKKVLLLSLLVVPAAFAETADERCLAAANEATLTFRRVASDVVNESDAAAVRAADKHAYVVCTSSEVRAELRNQAIVRWSGMMQRAEAKTFLEKALRETEVSEGPESAAVLPLLDAIAGLDSIVPERRAQSRRMAERATQIRRQIYGADSIEYANSLLYMGAFCAMEEMPDRNVVLAEQFYRDALAIIEKSTAGSEAQQTALAMLYELIKAQPGREADAEQLQEKFEENELRQRAARN
jgi:hypothetical protein